MNKCLLIEKTISDLIALNPAEVENIKYTCEAKLEEIDTTYGWWYKACYDCKGGVKNYDGTFWYKLNTIVVDDTGSANFTIFEKSAQDLIRVSAQQLATATNSNRFVLPPVVENVIGQTFVFQVSLETGRFNTSMQSFRVIRMFQSSLSAKVKIEEKDEDDADISGDGAPASPNGTENLIQSSDTDEEEK
uniref:Replication factor A C-terminal domain-containing protein n=1 Tax=Ananas comosus var. bracteatus TaxID=296719 RepID=A0A6V7PP94_ANACO|nr:unnamed protein product [Ananas comosus var. bracteatus]